ncbi:hypothetical protein [Pseudoalteromonas sp.]|uniref:hypothetical protein n=1 Tax=Pseudoalteromonas sp. TaxID=53249 RepID=UPI002619DF62|nr:hypothetical protein [Pseudoalteromonas sp.]MCP4587451.1 hypothetical protein [Pseudoalteromonas sp.]
MATLLMFLKGIGIQFGILKRIVLDKVLQRQPVVEFIRVYGKYTDNVLEAGGLKKNRMDVDLQHTATASVKRAIKRKLEAEACESKRRRLAEENEEGSPVKTIEMLNVPYLEMKHAKNYS